MDNLDQIIDVKQMMKKGFIFNIFEDLLKVKILLNQMKRIPNAYMNEDIVMYCCVKNMILL